MSLIVVIHSRTPPCASRIGTAREPGHKPNLVPTIVKLFIVDRLMAGTVGSPLNQEDRAADRHTQGLSHPRLRGDCFQAILCLDQRQPVFFFEQ